MNGERQAFLDLLHALEDKGVDDETIEELGLAFASYELDMVNTARFLTERLGDLTVVETVEQARELASLTLAEVLR